MSNRVLDVPALLDIATGRTQFMRARWHVARDTASTLIVPWCAAAEAARRLSLGDRAELRVFLAAPMVVVPEAPVTSAMVCAEMTSRNGKRPDWDAVQVVYEAVRRGWPIVTDDRHLERLLDLDPYLAFERLP